MTMMHRRRIATANSGRVMTSLRWRTSLVLLLCVPVRSSAFSKPPLPFHISARGGDTAEEEDEQIDNFIEDLISTVDSSSESSSEEIRDEYEIEEIVRAKVDIPKMEEKTIETNAVLDANVDDMIEVEEDIQEHIDIAIEVQDNEDLEQHDSEEHDEEEVGVDDSPSVVDNNEDTEPAVESCQDQKEPLANDLEVTGERKKSKKKSSSNVKKVQDLVEETDAVEEIKAVEQVPLVQQPLGPARPNALYRFLLHQGRLGHILVMICVLITELVQTYIPPLAHLLGFLFSFLLPSDKAEDSRSYRPSSSSRGSSKKVNAQYAAFVSSDGSMVRGKQHKQQVRKADQQAAEKLRQVGSIQDAKFRHVSVDFMKRHRIGSYRDFQNTEQLVVCNEREAIVSAPDGEEEESDVDWVVEALSIEKDETPTPTSPIKTSFGVDMGSDGATISVGVQFGTSKTSKKKKRRKTLAEAATERSPKLKPKPIGPRSSDRDGGGGVLGRIRAAGANSLVSRSLLGAYPGDAVPPSEAGSANGVIALAEKYGYGDWSDDEEDDGSPRRSVKRKQRSRTTSKPSSGGVSFQFGLSSSNSSSSKTVTKRPATTRQRKESIKDSAPSTEKSEILNARRKDSAPSTEKSEILNARRTNKLPERRESVQVRPPMEKLNEARAKVTSRKGDNERTISKLPEVREAVQVRSPMEKLNEARAKAARRKDDD